MKMRTGLLLFFLVLSSLLLNSNLFGQESYLFGEEQQLEIVVYVLGEVDKPGEYRIPDNTDIVKLLSKAGGETEFSNLGHVVITRYKTPVIVKPDGSVDTKGAEKEIIKFNINKFLNSKESPPAPILKPGDIIYVKKNKWYTWKTVAAVLRDLAIVASTYFLYVRTFKND
jgi:protein involved in polysaccharide export with SLBB domain